MTEMFGEAWSPMSVPDLAPDDDDDTMLRSSKKKLVFSNEDVLGTAAGSLKPGENVTRHIAVEPTGQKCRGVSRKT